MKKRVDPLLVLGSAIAEAGYWNWWDSGLPEAFQVNFGGIQLWIPPTEEGEAPHGHIAVRVMRPRSVAILEASSGGEPVEEWMRAMQDEDLEPVQLDADLFTFTDADLAREILEDAVEFHVMHGEVPSAELFRACPAGVVFLAEPFGFFACGEGIEVHGPHGEIPLRDIPRINEEWWGYWKAYWDARETDQPYPEDYACEVTTPIE